MKLYLVPTPIGNLEDITLRALKILKNVELILCEDTRTSGRLLKHYEIKQPLFPYHQHNEHKVLPGILEKLKSGTEMALITDAGSPGISDPGFLLLRACIREGIAVESLPGATAFLPALILSGLPSNRFVFEGFLPLKKGRQTRLRQLATECRTMIFYESPHRIVKALAEFQNYFGAERPASVSRELTKLYEETKRGTLAELSAYYSAHPPKGELVIVIAGADD